MKAATAKRDLIGTEAATTHPPRCSHLAFSLEDIQRMTRISERFAAIAALVSIVGGIVTIGTLLALLTVVGAFMERNARPMAVLRAYGLTKSGLRRQIFWRLGAAAVYSLFCLILVAVFLGVGLHLFFNTIGLPLPSIWDVLVISAMTFVTTLLGVVWVVYVSVALWWRRHRNVSQELS
jgi:hypothetical protein